METATVLFSEETPIRAEILMLGGETVGGAWLNPELEVALDAGPTLRIHASRISSISRSPDTPAAPSHANRQGSPADSSPPPIARLVPDNLVWIAPGVFTMGSPVEEPDRDLDEGPQTRVRLTRGFWMAKCEVTQEEYRALMETNPSLFVGDPHRPVERVRQRDAREYCLRLNRREQAADRLPPGYAYRLPTEAEWEYACRAGTTTRFSHGDDPEGRLLEDYAWLSANSESSTHPVGTRKPNAWGLHDLHGNVMEWCLDGSTGSLPGGEVVDFQAPPEGILRVARGGSWLYDAKACRSANRDSYSETTRSSDLGFRIVLAPIEP
jgi:formylglycine-generating enzyme required for sulfatase activity